MRATARFDLAVTGATMQRPWHNTFIAAPEDRITEKAHCAVLQLRAPRSETHVVAPADGAGDQPLLTPVATGVGLLVAKKEQLFAELGLLFERAVPELAAADIEARLWERERTQTTHVGHGVAIPHATVAGTERTMLVVAVLARPIAYDAQGSEVDVCLSLLGPPSDRETHLRLLSRLAGMLLETDVLVQLRQARSEAEVVEALARASTAQVSRPD